MLNNVRSDIEEVAAAKQLLDAKVAMTEEHIACMSGDVDPEPLRQQLMEAAGIKPVEAAKPAAKGK